MSAPIQIVGLVIAVALAIYLLVALLREGRGQ